MKIKIEQVEKQYDKGNIKVPVLKGVDFEIEEGEFVSIVGKSGSGKSTLLNLLGGLDQLSGGHIFFDEIDMQEMTRKELALHRKFTVGMIFQSFNLIMTHSASENIELALTFGGVQRTLRKAKASELLDKVGLKHRITHKPSELSGGEAQRVAIARAIANHPKVLLADEPTGNLDSTTSSEIIELILELNRNQGITVVMVTHDMELAHEVSDKIIHLKDGKVIEQINTTKK